MVDETENFRRQMVHIINATLSPDKQQRYHELCVAYGEDNVWDTNGVEREFEITGFYAPFCGAIRKSDNAKGLLEFCHSPRFYYNFVTK